MIWRHCGSQLDVLHYHYFCEKCYKVLCLNTTMYVWATKYINWLGQKKGKSRIRRDRVLWKSKIRSDHAWQIGQRHVSEVWNVTTNLTEDWTVEDPAEKMRPASHYEQPGICSNTILSALLRKKYENKSKKQLSHEHGMFFLHHSWTNFIYVLTYVL